MGVSSWATRSITRATTTNNNSGNLQRHICMQCLVIHHIPIHCDQERRTTVLFLHLFWIANICSTSKTIHQTHRSPHASLVCQGLDDYKCLPYNLHRLRSKYSRIPTIRTRSSCTQTKTNRSLTTTMSTPAASLATQQSHPFRRRYRPATSSTSLTRAAQHSGLHHQFVRCSSRHRRH